MIDKTRIMQKMQSLMNLRDLTTDENIKRDILDLLDNRAKVLELIEDIEELDKDFNQKMHKYMRSADTTPKQQDEAMEKLHKRIKAKQEQGLPFSFEEKVIAALHDCAHKYVTIGSNNAESPRWLVLSIDILKKEEVVRLWSTQRSHIDYHLDVKEEETDAFLKKKGLNDDNIHEQWFKPLRTRYLKAIFPTISTI
jgi:hypothetical protein